ncbi:MAG: hypothetical protein JJ896_02400 [Rhodothermales bacterium]|nr:hypothetical protein [Rhodothermales bacterium]MBO6778481.1 hypothetical protein [Rhodothermales bacterium]
MTNWAFENWGRIVAGATLLAGLFGLMHMMGRLVIGMPTLADGSTLALSGLVLGGYLIIGGWLNRNPLPADE